MIRKIAILGAGESGTGTAILARKQGLDVWVSDHGRIKDQYRKLLADHQIPFEEGTHSPGKIMEADEVMKSPGIPETSAIVKSLREKNIAVVSEIEFAGRYTSAKKICITGSNGKTTTTTLIWHILKKAGMNVALAGNIGQSFALQVAEKDRDVFVIEISSFQLDDMYSFRADIAVLLNITPDHLDRYGYDMQRYVGSKMKIIQNQKKTDCLIYCRDDEIIRNELEKTNYPGKLYPFSIAEKKGQGAWLEDEKLFIETPNTTFNMDIHDLALMGRHNTYNSMAAGIAASILKIRKEVIRESLSDFQGVEHRLEKVIKVHGIEFINDSKATNVNSAWYALESMNAPVVWIAGGVDKGNDYAPLGELVRKKVKAIVCLGKDNRKIHERFTGLVPIIVDASSMSEAVRTAYFLAKKNDVVLLSPACASFDLFDNYEDRGRQFKQSVRNL